MDKTKILGRLVCRFELDLGMVWKEICKSRRSQFFGCRAGIEFIPQSRGWFHAQVTGYVTSALFMIINGYEANK